MPRVVRTPQVHRTRIALCAVLGLLAVVAAWTVPVHAARYRGASLDGKTFPAVAYSYKSHRRWQGEVTFHGSEATFSTRGYGSVRLVLEDELIEDIMHIEASDEMAGTRWELSVTMAR